MDMNLEFFDRIGLSVKPMIGKSGRKWFCATEICKQLGFDNKSRAISTYCIDEHIKSSRSGDKRSVYLSFRDVIRLVSASDSPQSEALAELTLKMHEQVFLSGSYVPDGLTLRQALHVNHRVEARLDSFDPWEKSRRELFARGAAS